MQRVFYGLLMSVVQVFSSNAIGSYRPKLGEMACPSNRLYRPYQPDSLLNHGMYIEWWFYVLERNNTDGRLVRVHGVIRSLEKAKVMMWKDFSQHFTDEDDTETRNHPCSTGCANKNNWEQFNSIGEHLWHVLQFFHFHHNENAHWYDRSQFMMANAGL